MAAAAFRQTTTVAHSPSDCLYDVIAEVWVVALAVNVGRFFRVLSTVLYIFCRSPYEYARWIGAGGARNMHSPPTMGSIAQFGLLHTENCATVVPRTLLP